MKVVRGWWGASRLLLSLTVVVSGGSSAFAIHEELDLDPRALPAVITEADSGTESGHCAGGYGEGETWNKDPCTQCTCSDGEEKCEPKECPPPTTWPCDPETLHDPCCSFFCPEIEQSTPAISPTTPSSIFWGGCCVDDDGEVHEEGESWLDSRDPCIHCSCLEDGVTCLTVDCGPAPTWPCDPPTLPGQCCPTNCEPLEQSTPAISPTTPSSMFWGGCCVDDDGEVHEEGESWLDSRDPCINCSCLEDGVTCLTVDCGPAPTWPCDPPTLPGQCCCEPPVTTTTERPQRKGLRPTPKLIGTETECRDTRGRTHALHSTWQTDPCTTFTCTEDGVLEEVQECESTSTMDPSCQPVHTEGECCPQWNCSVATTTELPETECLDMHGKSHALHSTWQMDPCTTSTCTKDGVLVEVQECKSIAPMDLSCQPVYLEDECCPRWNCSVATTTELPEIECLDMHGRSHALNSIWQTDPCTTFTCTEDGVLEEVQECEFTVPMDQSCQLVYPEEECCPRWNCSVATTTELPEILCLDMNGESHSLNSKWQMDACTTFTCTEDGMLMEVQECETTAPMNLNCQLVYPEEECCPQWDCSVATTTELPETECLDMHGGSRALNSTWQTDPCTTFTCTEDGVLKEVKECESTAPKNLSCKMIYSEEECCPQWDCSVPTTTELPEREDLTTTEPPVTECLDTYGGSHVLNSTWQTDPCTNFTCTEEGIVKDLKECKIPSTVGQICQLIFLDDECCPLWECVKIPTTTTPLTTVPSGVPTTTELPEREDLTTTEPPSTECLDTNGGSHALNSTWQTDPCTNFTCTEEGIVKDLKECKIPSTVGQICQLIFLDDECCPLWECVKIPTTTTTLTTVPSGVPTTTELPEREDLTTTEPPVTECLDTYGGSHVLNSTWQTDPCTTFTCTEEGIVKDLKECKIPSTVGQICQLIFLDDECCPLWECVKIPTTTTTLTTVPSGVPTTTELPEREDLTTTEPPVTECLDTNGGSHALNSTWQTDPCTNFTCTEEGIVKDLKECKIPSTVGQICQLIFLDDECCPLWECVKIPTTTTPLTTVPSGVPTTTELPELEDLTTTEPPVTECLDTNGGSHVLNSTWQTNPCTNFTCTEEGIVEEVQECKSTSPMNPSCQLLHPEGECCPQWDCSRCLDSGGELREHKEVWRDPEDRCILCTCHSGPGIICVHEQCPPPPPWPCYPHTLPGQCCPNHCKPPVTTTTERPQRKGLRPTRKPIADKCLDTNGRSHALNSTWQTDPCTTFTCTKDGVVKEVQECVSGTTTMNQSCQLISSEDECCERWDCGFATTTELPEIECLDMHGGSHALDSTWQTDPCTTFTCTKDGVLEEVQECESTTLMDQTCQPVYTEGECCPQWNCSVPTTTELPECLDTNGGSHALNSTWQTDPCTTFTCTEDGVQEEVQECESTTLMDQTCQPVYTEGECCPQWNCSVPTTTELPECLDTNGGSHALNSTWQTDPCTTFTCTEDGVQEEVQECESTTLMDQTCQPVYTEGECCPQWNCSVPTTTELPECLDTIGGSHALNSTWQTDPCTTFTCTEDGVQEEVQECESTTLMDQTCQPVYTEGECCPQWNCSVPTTTELPECLDTNGGSHALNSTWQTDPCTTFTCTEDGVQEEVQECESTTLMDQTCQPVYTEGECCPQWNCSVPTTTELPECLDTNGGSHALNSTWQTDPCTTFTCTEDGVQKEVQECESTTLMDQTCQPVYTEGECCPQWNCSVPTTTELPECLDTNGGSHALNSTWQTDPCTTFTCTEDGVLEEVQECESTTLMDQTCQPVYTEGECCPQWNCSVPTTTELPEREDLTTTEPPVTECLDTNGGSHALNSTWQTDPCTNFTCTNYGIVEEVQECKSTSPKNPSCRLVHPEGECCPQWDCSRCLDSGGEFREHKEVWRNPEDPCILCTCHSGPGIICVHEQCPPPPPWPCYPHTLPGQCCPNHCKPPVNTTTERPQRKGLRPTRKPIADKCLDTNGRSHALNSTWQTDPCTTFTCTKDGVVKEVQECVSGTTTMNQSCQLISSEDECCERWDCGFATTTELPEREDLRTTTEATHAELECPDTEHSDQDLISTWQDDPCTTFTCTKYGIVKEVKACVSSFPVNPSCQLIFPEDECCPYWNCSDSGTTEYPELNHLSTTTELTVAETQCLDMNGGSHVLNSSWQTDPCTTFTCTKDGIMKEVQECVSALPIDPSCRQVYPEVECCPQWDCGVTTTTERPQRKGLRPTRKPIADKCLDTNGRSHALNSTWQTDPCTTFTCTKDGVVKEVQECESTTTANPGCQLVFPKDECCPHWDCGVESTTLAVMCVDKEGKSHPLGSIWRSDHCIKQHLYRRWYRRAYGGVRIPSSKRSWLPAGLPRGEVLPILGL
ncbi:kielin/chordin-like protein isoform X2 [Panulirus ornatus]|uniref:kielin/chordin-like protein isoform X2 n=1 Tax=Panulirus ornatus TaxID=150431 RepID=UPI003A860692